MSVESIHMARTLWGKCAARMHFSRTPQNSETPDRVWCFFLLFVSVERGGEHHSNYPAILKAPRTEHFYIVYTILQHKYTRHMIHTQRCTARCAYNMLSTKSKKKQWQHNDDDGAMVLAFHSQIANRERIRFAHAKRRKQKIQHTIVSYRYAVVLAGYTICVCTEARSETLCSRKYTRSIFLHDKHRRTNKHPPSMWYVVWKISFIIFVSTNTKNTERTERAREKGERQ